ncbi:MAG: metal ABC transporter ATP-binding protein [Muribaculaceae bacterium]|nr:metal ABC transporter ATP-binding protein [Muribaculaceae bacterium]
MTSILSSSQLPNQSHQQQPLIELSHIGMSRHGRKILSDINLTVNKGDFIALTGPNGSGKTTLLRMILGLLSPTEGRVVRYPALTSVGYLPQKNRIDSMFPISVSDVIASGLLGRKSLSRAERAARTEAMIRKVGLEQCADSAIGAISGGQLQRALLGRAIISDPVLLVMDEPLNFLDKEFEQTIYSIIRDCASRSTIVLVTHEMTEIAAMATRHLLITDGTLTNL